jgi:hypothetical protein
LSLIFGSIPITYAESRVNGTLARSIDEAKIRSDKEQEKIRVTVSFEADERLDSWNQRDRDPIKIRPNGTRPIEALKLDEADLSYEESGIDQSGLNRWHSDYEKETIEINFDEELRDVSSIKDEHR